MSIPISQQQHHQENYRYYDVYGSNRKLSREQQSPSQTQTKQRYQQHSQLQRQQLSAYASVVALSASAHVYAQKLNNVASMCLEIGHYDKAIASLGKALRLSEVHMVDQLMDRSQACTCSDCSLDGCLTFSEAEFNVHHSNVFNFGNQNKNNIKNNMMFVDDDYDQEQGGSKHTTSTS